LPVNTHRYPGSSEQTTENNLFTASTSLPAGLTGIDICKTLQGLPNVSTPSSEFLPVVGHPAWSNGCVMEYGLHQILIAPNSTSTGSAGPYLVLFCRDSDKNSLICPFEKI